MKQRNQDFALGLATLMFLALFVGTIIFLYPLWQPSGREIRLQFRADRGMAPLESGSPVLLGGALQVGRVESVAVREVELDNGAGPEREAVFLVTVELRDDVPLYGDCRISTGQPTIGGSGYVVINDVGTPGQELPDPVPGQPPQSLAAAIATLQDRLLADGGFVDQLNRAVDPGREDSLMAKILASLDDINVMTGELRTQLSPHEEQTLLAKLHRVMNDVVTTTGALRTQLSTAVDASAIVKVHAALDQLDAALTQVAEMIAEDRPLVHSSLTSVARATQALEQEALTTIQRELDPANPNGTLGKLHVAMDRVNTSLADLNEITDTGTRVVAVNRPALERTLTNFVDMSNQLRLASQEVLLNPSKLIWGPGTQREEQLLVFQAARHFAEAAGQLDDAASRLQAVLATLPADGSAAPHDAELQAISEAVQAAFQRFERAENTLWEQLD